MECTLPRSPILRGGDPETFLSQQLSKVAVHFYKAGWLSFSRLWLPSANFDKFCFSRYDYPQSSMQSIELSRGTKTHVFMRYRHKCNLFVCVVGGGGLRKSGILCCGCYRSNTTDLPCCDRSKSTSHRSVGCLSHVYLVRPAATVPSGPWSDLQPAY